MLEKLNFNDLLRYGFSGGTFLIALELTRVGFNSVIYNDSLLAESPVIALVAVVIGSLIYSLHCAFIQGHTTWLITFFHDRKPPGYKLRMRKYLSIMFNYDLLIAKNFKRDRRRWVRRCNYPKFQDSFDKWASQAHFLYGCGWAIMTGAIIGRHFSHAVRGHGWMLVLLVVLAILCLLGALIQDYALYYYDKKLMTDFHSKLHETKPTDNVT